LEYEKNKKRGFDRQSQTHQTLRNHGAQSELFAFRI